jgi:hypothetical protein
MTETVSAPAESTPAPAAPAAPSTSLQGDALVARQSVDSLRGTPAYWGDPAIQALDRALIRGEQAGSDTAIDVHSRIDGDAVPTPSAYDLSRAAGSRSMNAEQRDLADSFAGWGHQVGLGQRAFADAVGWYLTGVLKSFEDFEILAYGRNWTTEQIAMARNWWAAATGEQARDAGGRFSAARPAATAAPGRKAEIEATMYGANGQPGDYWTRPALREEYQRIIAAEIAR